MSENSEAHELITALKNLAIELGRTPSRADFEARIKGGRYRLQKYFGGYVALVHAAGLAENVGGMRRKIDNTIFEADIEEQLGAHAPKIVETPKQSKTTLIIPDTHFPFVHEATLERLIAFAGEAKPNRIIQIGDLYDNLSHGKFPRSHNVFTPREEMGRAQAQASSMWARLQEKAPGAECFQILGNHDIRPMRRLLESYPEAELFFDFAKFFNFPGVKLIEDSRQELILDNVAYLHGYKSQLGQHRDHMLMSCVTGHSHLGGVSYRSINGQVLWELNAGLLGDPESKGLSYTPQKITRWTLGWGFVDRYGPRFIPA